MTGFVVLLHNHSLRIDHERWCTPCKEPRITTFAHNFVRFLLRIAAITPLLYLILWPLELPLILALKSAFWVVL